MTDNYNVQKSQKLRSKTLSLQTYVESKSKSGRQRQSKILKIQSQIRKMKNLLTMEVELRNNKQELQIINHKLHQFESDVKKNRKEAINQQISSIQKRRQERQKYNKQSNTILAKIKMHNKQRRRKMQSLVKEYKQEYDQFYQKKLSQRRQLMKLDLKDIKQHQSGYLKVVKERNNNRIKTQNCDSPKYQSEIEIQCRRQKKNEDFQQKRHKILELVKKRKQYGQIAQKQALKIKISSSMVRKAKDKNLQTYDKDIDKYQQERRKFYKPKLDTNFQGDIQQKKTLQIMKIEKQQSPTKQKLTRLKNLADGYLLKFQNGQYQALDKVCDVNILRAKLLLQDS